ncbi:MAG TPA: hypothetical protein ENK05_11665 [Gammaproteobacteria bacterium]|nr:hypothetical protein [Gammaproteobacteria bacterium]
MTGQPALPEGTARTRIWLDPGVPCVVMRGLTALALVDRVDDCYEFNVLLSKRVSSLQVHGAYRAYTLNRYGCPQRILVELAWRPAETQEA